MNLKARQVFLSLSAAFVSLLPATLSAHANGIQINHQTVRVYRTDYCNQWSYDCDQPAADAYCRSEGYSYAINFRRIHINRVSSVVNSSQTCYNGVCDRTVEISCR